LGVATVTFDGTRINDADDKGAIWTQLGGGACHDEPDFYYQGTQSISEQVKTSENGLALDMVATHDVTGPDVWIAKVLATNKDSLNVQGSTGGILEIGSGGRRSDYDRYYVLGSDNWPIKGGWVIIPVDPNGGNYSARPGTAPTLTAIDYYGWAGTFSATSKSENFMIDAVDLVPNGSGLTIVDGTGISSPGQFSNFVTYDEGTVGNRYGIVASLEDVLYVTGTLTIGNLAATEFTGINSIIVFPEAEFLNSVGFYGLRLGLEHPDTEIYITNCVFKSLGTTTGTVDTRPDYRTNLASGLGIYTACTFNVFRNFTMTSGITLQDCTILNGNLLTHEAFATIDGCSISRATAASGTGFIVTNDPSNISNNSFTWSPFVGQGAHAIEITATGTFALDGNTFTDYGPDQDSWSAIYNNSGGAVTLNIGGGASTPTVRNGSGASTTLVNAKTVLVTVKDADDQSVIEGARVLLWADTGGDLPFEDVVTITSVSTTATVTHTNHGMPDASKVLIQDANEDAYNGVYVITVTTASEYTYTFAGASSPATGTILATAIILDGSTNASGVIQDTAFNYTNDQPIVGKARKGSATPLYKTAIISGTIDGNGFTTTTFLVEDE
jgi:hypothetical protein